MAVPTIASVAPASGLTKGASLVRLSGSNFRLPPAPPALGYVGGAAQRTVAVTFGGVACRAAAACTSTLIVCWPAPWAGDYATLPAAVAVRVANLDDAGVEIPGENVTRAAAYTVDRPALAPEGSLQRAVRAVLLALRRHVLANTHLLMSRDFDADPATPDRTVATLPALLVLGPTLRWDRTDAPLRGEPVADPADALYGWRALTPAPRVDLEFDLRIQGDGARRTFGLLQAVIALLRDHPTLTIDAQVCRWGTPFSDAPAFLATEDGADRCEARLVVALKGFQITDASDTLQIEAYGRTVYAGPTPVVQAL